MFYLWISRQWPTQLLQLNFCGFSTNVSIQDSWVLIAGPFTLEEYEYLSTTPTSYNPALDYHGVTLAGSISAFSAEGADNKDGRVFVDAKTENLYCVVPLEDLRLATGDDDTYTALTYDDSLFGSEEDEGESLAEDVPAPEEDKPKSPTLYRDRVSHWRLY